jgi:hypothetical protein
MDFVGIGDICEYDKMETKYDGQRFLQLFRKGELLTGLTSWTAVLNPE